MSWSVLEGDCVEVMRELDESSVDAVVTDPPYGLEFMGKEWDAIGRSVGPGGKRRVNEMLMDRAPMPERGNPWASERPSHGVPGKNPRCLKCLRLRFDHEGRRCSCDVPAFHARAGEYGEAMETWHYRWAVEVLRVLKPGGHLLAFGGTRTYHRLACALEDAGFEIRDCFAWLYGSGFPKSLDVSKAIDKAAGAEREVIGYTSRDVGPSQKQGYKGTATFRESADNPGNLLTAPATLEAEQWQGWGTALKPAFEPIVLARKPLAERNVAANVLAHGTGALNVDGTRIEALDDRSAVTGFYGRSYKARNAQANDRPWMDEVNPDVSTAVQPHPSGRWPANVILDEEAARLVDEASGERPSGARKPGEYGGIGTGAIYGDGGLTELRGIAANTGGASRFFYTAKTSRAEREVGKHYGSERNDHPTVKPVDLMRWLCRLVTPPGGLVLDPFTGSGSTGIAALREGFSFLGIEREQSYVEIARARIQGDSPLFNLPEEVMPL